MNISMARFASVAETGDCLLWRGNGLVSRLILLWTDYSHASLVVRLAQCGNRPFIVEATLPEVEFRDAVKRVKEYKGKVFLFKPKWISQRMRECIVQAAMETVAQGVPYDLKSLFANILGRVNVDAHAYFCSEFVWDIYTKCGVVRGGTKAPRPGDIPRLMRGDLYEITV